MNSSIVSVIEIADVYQLATNRTIPERRGRALRVLCPSDKHIECRPSCDLAEDRQLWICRSCGAGGGKLDLVVIAGHAQSRTDAARWLETKLGRATTMKPVYRFNRPRDIKRALHDEAARYRQQRGIAEHELLLTRELNEIRSLVARRYNLSLADLHVPAHEGYVGYDRDPLWAAVFEHAHDSLWFERTGGPPPLPLAERDRLGMDLSPSIRLLVEERAIAEYRRCIGVSR